MNSRLDLHEKLCEILGSKNVYFQPPESLKLSYDAIVYFRDEIRNRHAGNEVYHQDDRYEVTLISKKPDNLVTRKLSLLPKCRFDRTYISDNLYHDTFTLYL